MTKVNGTTLYPLIRRADFTSWRTNFVREVHSRLGIVPLSAKGLSEPFYFSLRVDEICQNLYHLNPNANLDLVRKAAIFAYKVHAGQLRKSGEPYIIHPLAITEMLVNELKVSDSELIAAGFLHDVIEEGGISKVYLEQEFGKRVALLVDGVTKFAEEEEESKEIALVKTYRKFIELMNIDLGIAILKFADRLHNMRTVGVLSEEKRKFNGEETLRVYVPIAGVLGLGKVKKELEDLGFKYYLPEVYASVKAGIDQQREENLRFFKPAVSQIFSALAEFGAQIDLSPRTYWEHYRISQARVENPEEAFDAHSIRILVPTEKNCYDILHKIYALYELMGGSVENYIAFPRPNLYRGIHLKLAIPGAGVLRVQIRTPEMEDIAQRGILTLPREQWKEKWKIFCDQLLTEIEERGHDSRAIAQGIEGVSARITVYTPKMKKIELSAGATALDFAFAVHTNIGLKAVAARVNGVEQPLNYPLRGGSVIRIITDPKAEPTLDWYGWVTLPESRKRLREYFSKLPKEVSSEMVKEALSKELEELCLTLEDVKGLQVFEDRLPKGIDPLSKGIKITNLKDLYEAILLGKVSSREVIKKFKGLSDETLTSVKERKPPRFYRVDLETVDRSRLLGDIATALGVVGLNISYHKPFDVKKEGMTGLTLIIDVYWLIHEKQIGNIMKKFGSFTHSFIFKKDLEKLEKGKG